ncbi:MAG: L,D-transpeptidase [Candidatus Hydrogenedentota bacterium]
MATAKLSQEAHDRRRDVRRLADEPVYLSEASGWSDLSIGMLLDASETGVAVYTQTPFAVGTPIELEVFSGSPVSLGRSNVIHGCIQNLRNHHRGGYRVGLTVQRPRPPKPTPTVSRSSQRSSELARPNLKLYPSEKKIVDGDRRKPTANRIETEDSLKMARATLLAIATLVCLGIFTLNQEDTRVYRTASGAGAGHYTRSPSDYAESSIPIAESAASPTGNTPADAQPLVKRAELLLLKPTRIQNGALRKDDIQSSDEGLKSADDKPIDDSELPISPGYSRDVTALHSEPGQISPSGAFPTRPRDFRSVSHAVQLQELDFTASPSMMQNWIPLSATLASRFIDAPVVLYVDTTNFVMHVVRNGDKVWQFPVGLGYADSTPHGVFSLGTKLIDPTWYNNGNPVPAGSDANPLGDRWMGLSDNDIPTPIGIHPTSVASSVGQPASRGCIRMRPADAHRLYAMVPADTPVIIGAGAVAPKL